MTQADLSLALFLRLFSAPLVSRMADELGRRARKVGRRAVVPPPIAHFLAAAGRYIDTVDPVIRFLQGRDPEPGAAHRRPRVSARGTALRARLRTEPLLEAFGALGTTEQARYLASLYVDDLADVWRDGIDPRFELSRYGERLAASAPTFDPLHEALEGRADAGRHDARRADAASSSPHAQPDVVALTAPFPGNVYGAFRIARAIREARPRDDARARRRLRQHRAARAARAARVRLRSTTSRSTTASGRC